MRRKLITKEEKVAIQLSNVLADLRLDLDMVGQYLAESSPNVIYNRLITIADSAEATKQEQYNHYNNYKLFQKGCSGGLDKSLPLCPREVKPLLQTLLRYVQIFPIFRHYEAPKIFSYLTLRTTRNFLLLQPIKPYMSNHVIMVL